MFSAAESDDDYEVDMSDQDTATKVDDLLEDALRVSTFDIAEIDKSNPRPQMDTATQIALCKSLSERFKQLFPSPSEAVLYQLAKLKTQIRSL